MRAVAILLLAAASAHAAEWDLSSDFSASANPNGAWSYGWTWRAGTTPFHLGVPQMRLGLNGWLGNVAPDGNPSLFENPASSTVWIGGYIELPAKAIMVHPGPNGEHDVVRFTVPADGDYIVDALFSAKDSGGTDVHVLRNGKSLWDGALVWGVSLPYSMRLSLLRGDTLDFDVGYGIDGSFGWDSTGLAVHIKDVPPVALCVGTVDQPFQLATVPDACGVTIGEPIAGNCVNGVCSFDGQTTEVLGPGAHEVTVVATAPSGVTASCTSYLVVADETAPTVQCPAAAVVECTGPLTPVQPVASCQDACGCSASCDAGSYGVGGPYGVGCEAKDAAGNVDGCVTSVTVVDTIPPVAVSSVSPAVLWPPNHDLVAVDLSRSALDTCDPAPALDCAVSSNESTSTAQWQWVGGQLYLRAERNASGSGRVYTIACVATDRSGNRSAPATVQVHVPHDSP